MPPSLFQMTDEDRNRAPSGDDLLTCTQNGAPWSPSCGSVSAELSAAPVDDLLIESDSDVHSALDSDSLSELCDVYSSHYRGLEGSIQLADSAAHSDFRSASISEDGAHVDEVPVTPGNPSLSISSEEASGPNMPTLTPRQLRASRRASLQEAAAPQSLHEGKLTITWDEFERLSDQRQRCVQGRRPCPLRGCGARPTTMACLRRHLVTHIHPSEKRGPICSVCNIVVSRKDALRRHMKTQHRSQRTKSGNSALADSSDRQLTVGAASESVVPPAPQIDSQLVDTPSFTTQRPSVATQDQSSGCVFRAPGLLLKPGRFASELSDLPALQSLRRTTDDDWTSVRDVDQVSTPASNLQDAATESSNRQRAEPPASTIKDGRAQEEPARHPQADISPFESRPLKEVNIPAHAEPDIAQLPKPAAAQSASTGVPVLAPQPLLVPPIPLPAALANSAPLFYLVVPPSQSHMARPLTFYVPPAPQPQAVVPAPGPLKKSLTVAGSSKKARIARPSAHPSRVSRKNQALVSSRSDRAHGNAPTNTVSVCSFPNCRYESSDPTASFQHLMTHAVPGFRCDWCGVMCERVDMLNAHVAKCELAKQGAEA